MTSTKPADWFTDDTLPLLEAYVEAAQSHRVVSAALAKFTAEMLSDADSLRQYDKASQIQNRVAGTLAQMAIKMRLSQSARYGARGAEGAHKRTLASKKPWEN